jgi:hypothetical protein
MSVTMVSRLLLNLHRLADQGVYTTYSPEETDTYTNTGMLFTSRFTSGTGATSGTDDDFELRVTPIVPMDDKTPAGLRAVP